MNRRIIISLAIVLIIVTMQIVTGCSRPAKTQDKAQVSNNITSTEQLKDYSPGVYAFEFLTDLSKLPGRIADTDKEDQAASFIVDELEKMGYEVTTEPFDYNYTEEENDEEVKGSSQNIIASKEGSSDDMVVLGAHYDSVSVGDGVDDNGSGVAVVLEIAKVMKDIDTYQTLKFVFFGAEEVDIFGSKAFVSDMSEESINNTLVMFNYDGLIAGDKAYVYGDIDKSFYKEALAVAADKGLKLTTQPGKNPDYPKGTSGDWSDHAPFKDAGIPYVYFESTDWSLGELDGDIQCIGDYGEDGLIRHTKYDTLEYIESSFPGRIASRLALFSEITVQMLLEDLSE